MCSDEQIAIKREEPTVTGSLGTQKAQEVSLELMAKDPKSLSSFFSTHGEAGWRAQAMKLAGFGALQIETSLTELRKDLASTNTDLRTARAELGESQKRVAVLEERLRSGFQISMPANLLLTMGGIVAGCGIQQLMTASNTVAWVAAIIGLLLVAAAWFHNYKLSNLK